MASRKIPLVTGEIYHVYNRSIARQQIFLSQRHYHRMTELIQFYIFTKPTLRFSYYNRLAIDQRKDFFAKLQMQPQHVQIYAHALMPNHFHFLLKQTSDAGISKFLGNLQNSYAKYLNLKQKRTGSVFQEMFKAVRIETDEHLLHVTRYILLNPYTGYVIKDLGDLEMYPWTSFPDYMGSRSSYITTEFIQSFFKSPEKLKQFILDQAAYQRELDQIKHLILE